MATITTKDIQEFLEDLRSMSDDFTRRMHLIEHWPNVPANFWKRVTPSSIMRMDVDQFMTVLSHADPTGEKATRNAHRDMERAA